MRTIRLQSISSLKIPSRVYVAAMFRTEVRCDNEGKKHHKARVWLVISRLMAGIINNTQSEGGT